MIAEELNIDQLIELFNNATDDISALFILQLLSSYLAEEKVFKLFELISNGNYNNSLKGYTEQVMSSLDIIGAASRCPHFSSNDLPTVSCFPLSPP